MKVILQQDVKAQGKKGQLIDASDGYARNYLIPRGLAIEANAAALNVMKTQQQAKEHHILKEKETATELAKKLNDLTVVIKAKAGTSGRIFGSVTSKEIAEELKAKYNMDLDKRKLVLSDTIKNYGDYLVQVKLYPEVTAKLKIKVGE